MTTKNVSAQAEAIRFLRDAENALDQADSCLEQAGLRAIDVWADRARRIALTTTRLRKLVGEMAEEAAEWCSAPECEDPAQYTCEVCGARFCAEHGQSGGDRQVQDVGAVAYPALCDKCRGI